MTPKIFVDTNILVDFFDATRPDHADAAALFEKIEAGEVKAYVSESVLNTLTYLLRKGFTVAELKSILSALLNIITVLGCNNDTFLKSLTHNATDIEDAVLYQIALEHKLNFFVTSDKKGFKKIISPLLPVTSAAALTRKFSD